MRFAPALLILLAACVDRAEVNALLGPPPPGNDYLELLPYDDLLVPEPGPTEADAEMVEALQARADDLRRRAAGIAPAE